LEEHADDGHHCQSAIGELCIKPACLDFWVISGKQWRLPPHVPWSVLHVSIIVSLKFCEASIGYHLNPASEWNLAESSKPIGNVRKLQFLAWRQKTRELPCYLGCDVPHSCKHANAAVLDFYRTSAFEGKLIPILGESQRIEETNGCLHTQLVLEGSKRRIGIGGPIPPRGSCESILEEHSNDCHHSQATIGKFCI